MSVADQGTTDDADQRKKNRDATASLPTIPKGFSLPFFLAVLSVNP